MNCQQCNEREASVNVHVRLNQEAKQLHLCHSCFEKLKANNAMSSGLGSGGSGFFSSLPFEDMFKQFANPNMGAQHNQQEAPLKTAQGGRGGKGGILDEMGKNLTDAARAGLIDPVIGRDEEVARVVEILNRRNKNNPVLIGEAGVGKTAIVEGLALKISEGDVPSKLLNKEVYSLDVASLVSNTGIRGQFEERMKQLISELQSRQNVILFIDEIHQIVGAGSAEGSMDAGNILKPALSRGELQLVGATTLKEYRTIEKDAALERRFQPITVQEPTVEETIEILRGLQERYQAFHEVSYTAEAIEACAVLSHRYIQDRFLPDKAIDLLDESGSKQNLKSGGLNFTELEERLNDIAVEKKKALDAENYEVAAKLRDEEEKLEKQVEKKEEPRAIVDVEQIQAIVEKNTGIPVGKLQTNEATKMKNLAENLSEKVIGQDEAVEKVAKAVRRSRAGLKAKERPIGSFLFVGPTGVGKTELSKTLAEEMFGSKDAMIRLDMSEYMEKHSVSKLIGSPPGYVGHEDAGQLTEKVRRHPYSIILLDEIEKAHPDVQHAFLQILEDGRLTDSQGRRVSFKDTVVIMTSNAGTSEKKITVGFDERNKNQYTSILDSLSQYFKPEFLNRFDSIIEFNHLEKDSLLKIVDLMLVELEDMLDEQSIKLQVSDEAKEKLTDLGYNPTFGARPLRRVIQEQLEDQMTDLILDNENIELVSVDVVDDKIVVK